MSKKCSQGIQKHIVNSVTPGSIAEEMEIEVGDELVSINNQSIVDVFDYQYLLNDEFLTVLIRKPNNEEWELEIEKEENEDLGIEFKDSLMDDYKSCRNKCIFCFIDQMPSGMRETLYFKDDDARLSFLQGNYITLTNMSDEDIDRIIFYHLSPINISVHTTNMELRKSMLKNRFADKLLERVEKLHQAGITMNGQIVLCKGINDGEELERSIHDLSKFLPHMQSVSVVPVGLTKFREGLTQLEKFNQEDAIRVIETITKWQNILYEHYKTRMIYASDEWYLLAGMDIPTEERYENYMQIENGVGMIRSLKEEVYRYIRSLQGDNRKKRISLATGVLATSTIKELVGEVTKLFPNIEANVYTIQNNYFGKDITVAGLLTGTDIIEQLKNKDLGEYLILPHVLLRSGEKVLLDDLKLSDLERTLQIKIRIVQSDGKSFVDAIIS